MLRSLSCNEFLFFGGAMVDLEICHRLACAAAAEAGEAVATMFQDAQKHEEAKDDGSLVTLADKTSDGILARVLRSYENLPILSEENEFRSPGDEFYWVVDPLDGTANFARGIPAFVICIALMHGNSVEVGVTYNPTTSECFSAIRGQGAFCGGQRLSVRRVPMSGRPYVCYEDGRTTEARTRTLAVLEKFRDRFGPRRFGACALELTYLASGRIDGFLSSEDHLWDYASGLCICREAGALITDWRGREWDNSSNFLVVAAPWIQQTILEAAAEYQIDAPNI